MWLASMGWCVRRSLGCVIDVRFSHESWRGRVRTGNGVGSSLSAEEVERFDAELAELLASDAR